MLSTRPNTSFVTTRTVGLALLTLLPPLVVVAGNVRLGVASSSALVVVLPTAGVALVVAGVVTVVTVDVVGVKVVAVPFSCIGVAVDVGMHTVPWHM